MSALGKSSKKNQKRAEKRAKERAQKLKEDGVIDRLIHEHEDPVEKLKTQLQEAKDNKDHKLAAKLRKDLWIMQDQMAGCVPPGEEAEHVAKSVEQCENKQPACDAKDQPASFNPNSVKSNAIKCEDTENNSSTTESGNTQLQTEKKLRNLKKKLQQIEKLKLKQENGEVLEDLQIAKIHTEKAVLEETEELQERLGQL